MLVVEDRHERVGGDHGGDRCLEQATARIEDLIEFIATVFAVFADQQHAIDIHARFADADRFRDRAEDRHAMPRCHCNADIVGRDLIEVDRNDLDARLGGNAVEVVALEQFGDDDICVRVFAVLSEDGGNGFSGHGSSTLPAHSGSDPRIIARLLNVCGSS